MRPLIVAWPEGLAAWAVYLWAMVPEVRLVRRARAADAAVRSQAAAAKGDPTLHAILVAGLAGMVGATAAAFLLPAWAIWPERARLVYWVGLAVVVAGGLLRRHCWRMLGASFTGHIAVRPDQAVVERGAYRWVRHPSYTAGLLLQVGVGLALGNWASVALLVVPAAAAYAYRITLEERALMETLGERYRAYRQRTRRLVPFVW
jgi:protein-S-isoprenylcysteine O-methyltransferase Ste14